MYTLPTVRDRYSSRMYGTQEPITAWDFISGRLVLDYPISPDHREMIDADIGLDQFKTKE